MAVKPATWDDVTDDGGDENDDVTDDGDSENDDVTDSGGENDDVETCNSCLFSSSFTLHTSITVPAYLDKGFFHNKHQQHTIEVIKT